MLAAKLDGDKAVRYSFGGAAPIMVWDRVPWHRSSAWLMPLLYLSLAVLLATAILWPTRAVVRRRFGATLSLEKRGLQAYRASRIAAVAILVTLIGWLVTIQTMFADLTNLSAGMDPILVLLQILSIVAFIGGFAVMLWYCWTAWRGKWDWPAKLWSILLVISAFTVLWIGFAFNLIGMTTSY
jgi:hypothetical protein